MAKKAKPKPNEYDRLFLRYVAELRGALAAAKDWWAVLEERERSRFPTAGEADASLEARWPFGPSSHPWVLGVYRKYYLLTEALNARNSNQNEPEGVAAISESDWGEEDLDPADLDLEGDDSPFAGMQKVAPWILLFDSLHGRDDDLANALEFMIYKPVGLDVNDNVL
jgi:hypothetical protein